MKFIGKILILAVVAFGVFVLVGSAPVHACPYPDPDDPANAACATTTTETTTTTTTLLEVEATSVVTVVIPEGDIPGRSVCAPGEYRQSYAPDAPCGPTDPCLEEGTTLWQLAPCGPSTTVAAGGGTIPATGGDELALALCALGFVLVGVSVLLARRV